MMPSSSGIGPLGRIARAFSVACLSYWAIYALVAPVTNVDSQMYNLARLELASRDGLFNNALFTSAYHLAFPWTYDAVHLPFLSLGWGYALPSYCCLAGTCYVAFAMMRERFGPDAGWLSVIGLFSLTCLVYQGSTTKNDIPILFTGAVWIYARWRRRRETHGGHLFWMILSVGFMAGSKTIGLLYGCFLGLWTLWDLRHDRRRAAIATVGFIGAGILFGSVETYIETARAFGDPLGPPQMAAQLENHDGLAGGAANLSRYIARSIYVGPTSFRPSAESALRLAAAERSLLAFTGLTDKGISPQFKDDHLFLYQSGLEELSGFGPTGTIAMATMLLAIFFIRPRRVWWQLGSAALLGLVVVSLTVAYSDWAGRYLISCYALSTVAAVCFLSEHRAALYSALRWGFLGLAVVGAVAAPFLSFNRGPAALIAALRDREQLETSAYPLSGAVRARLRELRDAMPRARIFYVTCNDSVILPILEDKRLDAILVTPPVFLRLAADGRVAPGDLVIEDYPTGFPRLEKIDEVSAPDVYAENSTRRQSIYRVVPATVRVGGPNQGG